MNRKSNAGRRSDCPLSIALELFGDPWTLLILRDLLFKRFTTFKEFQESGEGISTNILANRLQRLQAHGLITAQRSTDDARVVNYAPTEPGLELLPILVEMIVWSARNGKTAAPAKLIERMTSDREGFIREVRSRFQP